MSDSSFSGAFTGEGPPASEAPNALCRVTSLPYALRLVFFSGSCFMPPLSIVADAWPGPPGLQLIAERWVDREDDGSSLQRRSERYGNETTLSLVSLSIQYDLEWWGPRFPGDRDYFPWWRNLDPIRTPLRTPN
eukprot:786069-Karenia_brevis.AAC.1